MSEQNNTPKSESESEISLAIHDIDKLKESLNYISGMLNGACKKGYFDLDEAFNAKVACENLLMAVSSLKQYQDFAIRMDEHNKRNKQIETMD